MVLKIAATLALWLLDWGFYTGTDLAFWRTHLAETKMPWFLFILMNGVLLYAIWLN